MGQAVLGQLPDGALDAIAVVELVGVAGQFADQLVFGDLDRVQVGEMDEESRLGHLVIGRRVGARLVVHGKCSFLCRPRGRSTAARGISRGWLATRDRAKQRSQLALSPHAFRAKTGTSPSSAAISATLRRHSPNGLTVHGFASAVLYKLHCCFALPGNIDLYYSPQTVIDIATNKSTTHDHREADPVPRAIVYEPPAVQAHYAELVREAETPARHRTKRERTLLQEARAKADANEPAPRKPMEEGAQTGKDSYLEKIAKYVPAEVVTLTTLAVAAFRPAGDTIWWIVALGALANALYLFGTAVAATRTPMPRWYFYPLAVAAYLVWAAAIIPEFGQKVGIGGDNAQTEQTFALAVGAFLIPLLDSIMTNLSARFGVHKPQTGSPTGKRRS
jgi:hypothetical protein